ncbi:hypothetical protein D1007_44659 [Hordeum vulgare]|nr:hypothetical protein D1007_44659 [Hordeum vulgare]
MMAHAQMFDDNLLIILDMTVGVIEVESDHFVLVILSKQLLNSVDGVLHHDRVVGVPYLEVRLPNVDVHFGKNGELPLGPVAARIASIGSVRDG